MNYLKRRFLTYVGVFFVVLNLDFILPRLAPGNAARILAAGSKFTPQASALLIARFGLDKPILTQYYLYLKGIFLTWPPYFGTSFQFYPEPVTDIFVSRIGWTLLLILSAFVLATILAYVAGGFSSMRRGGIFERGSLYTAVSLHAIPAYWIAMVILWIFAVRLNWFPTFGNVNLASGSTGAYVISVIEHAVLPVVTLAVAIWGSFFMLLRGSIQQVLKSDFVSSAKTRGLPDRIVATKYILRNSLLPFVAILSFSLASLMSDVILVEAVFGYPGIGDLLVDAISSRDYPVLQGALFFIVVMVIVGGFIGDYFLVRLDPQLRR
ncbi:MAG: ABC transporter permease [Thaumarchaeota archaeon]|nr:ABC transporter permease [Nitrososphaerota archaeon]